jgi:hypothetical protein
MKRLTEDQLEEVAEKVAEWNDRGPSEDIQQKYLFVAVIIHVQSLLLLYIGWQPEVWHPH